MRRFGLIGFPLTHSFSKDFFSEKFRNESITGCEYENFQLASIDELPAILSGIANLEGLNVTIPYKESVLPLLAASSDLVKQTSACNCIRIVSGKLLGYNTDVIGFEDSLKSRLKPWHRKALILGTGGAARAVEFVLKKNKIDFQYVSRQASSKTLSYEQLSSGIVRDAKLIINASPIGMYPKVDEAPNLPYEAITPEHFLFDLIYNPAKTIFLQKGEQQGAIIQNGYDMLVGQAEESWAIWNEPVEVRPVT